MKDPIIPSMRFRTWNTTMITVPSTIETTAATTFSVVMMRPPIRFPTRAMNPEVRFRMARREYESASEKNETMP